MRIDVVGLLTDLHEQHGSDLHLSTGSRPQLRLIGELVPRGQDVVTEEAIREVFESMTTPEMREEYEHQGEVDFAWTIQGIARYRVNFYKMIRGMAASFREIPSKVPSMRALGVPQHLQQLAMLDRGLIIATGPTGSGKSTTIASIVDYANQMRKDHILTIEAPIEFVYENKGCLVSQREVGAHTKSFATALCAALREDPDIIVVGEMRDQETIQLAIEAAETGHLVFATLHTSSAAKTIDRIIDTFPAESQQQIKASLAESLQGILSVCLPRRKDGSGRVLAMEILLTTPAIRNMIREGKTYQIINSQQTGHDLGMCTMDDQLLALYSQGTIDKDAVLRYARNRGRVLEELNADEKEQ